MRRTSFTGNFFIVYGINLLLNLEWSIPAWILLILHFVPPRLSLLWFVIALIIWLTVILVWQLIIGAAANVGSKKEVVKENKNPYSAKPLPDVNPYSSTNADLYKDAQTEEMKAEQAVPRVGTFAERDFENQLEDLYKKYDEMGENTSRDGKASSESSNGQ